MRDLLSRISKINIISAKEVQVIIIFQATYLQTGPERSQEEDWKDALKCDELKQLDNTNLNHENK